jgi:hypothetical protein
MIPDNITIHLMKLRARLHFVVVVWKVVHHLLHMRFKLLPLLPHVPLSKSILPATIQPLIHFAPKDSQLDSLAVGLGYGVASHK